MNFYEPLDGKISIKYIQIMIPSVNKKNVLCIQYPFR